MKSREEEEADFQRAIELNLGQSGAAPSTSVPPARDSAATEKECLKARYGPTGSSKAASAEEEKKRLEKRYGPAIGGPRGAARGSGVTGATGGRGKGKGPATPPSYDDIFK